MSGNQADEFLEVPPSSPAGFERRTFLKAAGFSFAGAFAAGCSRAPVQEFVPFLEQPEGILSGKAYYYASTCTGCSAGCGLIVKNRDGRPIKLEGNPEQPIGRGSLCAVGQASILGLYDRKRLRQPLKDKERTTWNQLDNDIRDQLEQIRKQGKVVRVVSHTITSPTTRAWLDKFLVQFKAQHVEYDALSCSAILDAHLQTHGARVLPRYHLEKAQAIVSFDADFLGTWISPVEFSLGYRAQRNLEQKKLNLSYHVQFESRLSLTGSKADKRIRLAPGELGLVLTQLASRIAQKALVDFDTPRLEEPPVSGLYLDQLAQRLWHLQGRCVVLCGSQDVEQQILTNFINERLGNYHTIVDVKQPSFQRQGSDRDLAILLKELSGDKVGALFILDANPVFDLPGGEALAKDLARVPLLVSCSSRMDETTRLAKYVCPIPHNLESWGDVEAVAGVMGLMQPALRPLGKTRSIMESLAAWTGKSRPALELLQAYWKDKVFPRRPGKKSFQEFWDNALHAGFALVKPKSIRTTEFATDKVKPILKAERPAENSLALVLYPKVGMLDGSQSYNPWLQELPDPISKVSWDNYACLSPKTAKRYGVGDGDVVKLEMEGSKGRILELPVLVQPGQHDQVVAVALGYGARVSARFADVGPKWLQGKPTVGDNGLVGSNASLFMKLDQRTMKYTAGNVAITRTGKKHPLASTQTHHSINVPEALAPKGKARRPVIQELTLAQFSKNQASGKKIDASKRINLWPPDHTITGRRWGMAIDLSACTGCSACVVACQAENNVPVVGRDEIRRQREMHWLRIDRYYSGDDGDVDVAFQPMMCQHCGNAPCETVCPVLATVHGDEGLNQQVYNRCVGTRYCANNCPYKVRRFNWFNYAREDVLENLVLNPDVTVRSRGVMEKCSLCVQRIQEAKIEAKRKGEAVHDGDIQTACQQTCPAKAIVFGDLDDPKSRVAQLVQSARNYRVLVELNVEPVVNYLALVRNRSEEEGKEHNG